ncbi:hypothetical protein QRD25_24440 (plasmid) [Serratia marcescens]|uniref:hypothetical protein n=2 Tax=Serratia TaxID=613 RepID=UPI0025707575|nr:hypothetical protein [Serratia marcescens]WJD90493.1 hypothetical protein QRD25_24440 [Serratia marcescens]
MYQYSSKIPHKRSHEVDKSKEPAKGTMIEDGTNSLAPSRNIISPLNISPSPMALTLARGWLYKCRKKRADNSFLRMQKRGAYLRDGVLADTASMPGAMGLFIAFMSSPFLQLPSFFGEEINVKELAVQNYKKLQNIKFNTQEENFIDCFVRQDFYLVHATNANIENKSGDINIYSRKLLQDKGIFFNEDNSTHPDIHGLGNDDYAFFSFEIGPELKKQTSRFGNTIYKVSASNTAFKYASLSLVDQLVLDFPEPKIPGLSALGKKELSGRPEFKNSEVFFNGMKSSISSLSRHIALATRYLSQQSDIDLILNERNPERLERIMNYLFRPEVRVPKMAGIKKGGYFKYKFGSR